MALAKLAKRGKQLALSHTPGGQASVELLVKTKGELLLSPVRLVPRPNSCCVIEVVLLAD